VTAEHVVLTAIAVIGALLQQLLVLAGIMQIRAARREQAEATQRLAALHKATLDHLAAVYRQRDTRL
jgi:hypothetical protein